MLETLHIKNVVLIEDAFLSFGDGLNIVSGETGSGKSMMMSALNFVLGGRANKEIIRIGEEQAEVEALFSSSDEEVISFMSKQAIPIEDDNNILIKRIVNQAGKTINKINGSTVTAGMLKAFSMLLLDIHGQHEHQSLLNNDKHIIILDKFCGQALEDKKKELAGLLNEYKGLMKQIKSIAGKYSKIGDRTDIIAYQLEEINNADIKLGEEDVLLNRKRVLNSEKKIFTLVSESLNLIETSDEGKGVSEKIGETVDNLRVLQEMDNQAKPIFENAETAAIHLSELERQLRTYIESIETNPKETNDIEERLSIIYSLKKKYGATAEEILSFRDSLQAELDMINSSEGMIEELENVKKSLYQQLVILCRAISHIRRGKADAIQGLIQKQLNDLEMKDARFKIAIEQKNQFGNDGWDKVEFLIATNGQDELKPISKIASGGEISRTMLAFKTVIGSIDSIETFIFDEIDTGVSGRTAQKVAEKIAYVSRNKQMICITHLPQIAAMADTHFLIEKSSDGKKVTSSIISLDEEGQIMELTRLLAGASATEATFLASKQMKDQAKKIKEKIKA